MDLKKKKEVLLRSKEQVEVVYQRLLGKIELIEELEKEEKTKNKVEVVDQEE